MRKEVVKEEDDQGSLTLENSHTTMPKSTKVSDPITVTLSVSISCVHFDSIG